MRMGTQTVTEVQTTMRCVRVPIAVWDAAKSRVLERGENLTMVVVAALRLYLTGALDDVVGVSDEWARGVRRDDAGRVVLSAAVVGADGRKPVAEF
jgi:hypothetical protein